MSNNSNLDLNGLNPLSYLGVNPKTPVPFFSRSADPTPEDYDNFILGTIWLNTANENIWMLVSKASRIAVWVQLSAGSSGAMTSLTGNSGGLVMPLGGNINVVGDSTTINIVGNPGTHTLTASLVGGGIATQSFITDAGTAVPNGSGILNVIGAGAVSTSASGNTITVSAGGAAVITITGNTGGPLVSSSFTFTGGTTGLSFGGAGTTQTLTFAGITANGGTVSLATDATASMVNIGTGAGDKTVTLGSTNTTSTTNIQSGSGGIKIPAFSEGALVTSNSGVISTVTGAAGDVLTANAPGVAPSFQPVSAATISITGDTGGALTGSAFTFTGGTTGLSFGGAGSTETLTFAGITANGGTVSLATDATTSTVNIGTGAGDKTVTLGSTNTTSTTNLQSGSGGIKIPAFAEGALVTSNTGVVSTVTGTAGFVLTANAAGTEPSFQVVGAASGALILSATVVLTSAQVKTLHATPQTILPAPGAGKFISVITAYGKMTYGGNNPFVAATTDVRLYYTSVSSLLVNTAASNPTITATSTSYDYFIPSGFNTQLGTTIENAPIVAANPSAVEISGNAAGDNTLSIIIAYTILPI